MKGATEVSAGGHTFHILLIGGKPEEPSLPADDVFVGEQQINYDGKKIVFGKMVGPPKLKRLGCW